MSSSSIPKTMRAVRVTEHDKPYSVDTIPVPSIGDHDLLVKVAAASHCHTDSMVLAGKFGTKLPVTPSHEGAGTVVSTGSSVTSFKTGGRVMCGLPLHPCGFCPDCTSTSPNTRQYYASVEGHVGVFVDGCLAEYVCVDARFTTKVPDEVSLVSAAPLACAGRTVWRAVLQTGLKEGEWVAIVGSGNRRLKVIGIDARDEGLSFSRENGADVVLDARKEKEVVVNEVKKVTAGYGADATIVLSDVDSAAALGCAVTRIHGTLVEIAQPDEVKIPFEELVFRDVKVKGSLLCSLEESKGMMDAIVEKGLNVKTNRLEGLEKIHELVELVHGGKIEGKAVVIVDQGQIEREKELGVKW